MIRIDCPTARTTETVNQARSSPRDSMADEGKDGHQDQAGRDGALGAIFVTVGWGAGSLETSCTSGMAPSISIGPGSCSWHSSARKAWSTGGDTGTINDRSSWALSLVSTV